jgi:branched-chain amino acid transport system permease protein
MKIQAIPGVLATALVLAGLPLLHLPSFYESLLYLIFIWVVLAVSWNVLSGYSGYFSFGHGAFYGLGVYTTAVLSGKLDWPFLATLPLAALVPALFGIGLGAVVFRVRRLRGELFALLTLAITFVVSVIILNTPIDGGPGIYLSNVPVPQWATSPASTFYLLALALATLTLCVAHVIYRGKLGLGLFAIHDDEDVAEVQGVQTYRYKLIALGISCALAGMAGGIQALFVSYVTVGEIFNMVVPLFVMLMSVLGGTRHWLGPAMGAAFITVLLYSFTSGEMAVMGRALVGLSLIVVILFLPKGLVGQFLHKRRHAKGWAPDLPQPKRHAPAVVQSPQAGPLFKAERISKNFNGVQALSEVNLEVRPGEILGLVGPNGSGKSTMVNVITGLFKPEQGHLWFMNEDLVPQPSYRAAQLGIARTYQIPRPYPNLTVLQNVVLPALFGSQRMSMQEAREQAMHSLEFVGLADRALSLPTELNLHQRKFLELARALANSPRLVLLDEVLAGLTPTEIEHAILTVRTIRDQGSAILFIEHNMRAVLELSDRLMVLNHGKVIACGEPRAVIRQPDVVTAYLGASSAQP